MIIDKQLLTFLVCPVTKTPLQIDTEKQELISTAAKLAYPVRNDIPVMLEDQARALSQDEFDYWHSKK